MRRITRPSLARHHTNRRGVAFPILLAYRACVSATTVQLDPFDPADSREDVRFGTLDDARVAVWNGTPPEGTPEHECVAPVLPLQEEDNGARYAEVIPEGIRLIEAEPPTDVARYVVARVLRALCALHAAGLHHGNIDERTVAIGLNGEVVLFGRGRRPGAPNTDVLAAMSLLPPGADITVPGLDAEGNAERMEDSLPAGVRARLAGWVRTLAAGRVDEVVPDVGPENDSTGLLDRYAPDEAEFTADVNPDEDSSTQMNLGSTLWRTLAAPPLHEPPPNRFAATRGQPSQAVARILSNERVLRHDVPTIGPIEPFVVDTPASPTDLDDDSSHTALGNPNQPRGPARPDPDHELRAITPRPADIPRVQPPTPRPTPTPRQTPKEDGTPWMMLILVGVGTGAIVAGLLWYGGMLG